MSVKATARESALGSMKPSKAIVKLAIPATIALLAKAVYNIVDTAYIGMLGSDTALAAVVIGYGARLLISQVALYPAFGLCYMMTITFQTIGASRYGLFLSVIRQGLFYLPFNLTLPRVLGVNGLYFAQSTADVLTLLVCVFSIRPMKRIASEKMKVQPSGQGVV